MAWKKKTINTWSAARSALTTAGVELYRDTITSASPDDLAACIAETLCEHDKDHNHAFLIGAVGEFYICRPGSGAKVSGFLGVVRCEQADRFRSLGDAVADAHVQFLHRPGNAEELLPGDESGSQSYRIIKHAWCCNQCIKCRFLRGTWSPRL